MPGSAAIGCRARRARLLSPPRHRLADARNPGCDVFQYIIRRIIFAVPALIGVSIVVFLMLHATPGDPAQVIAGPEATTADIENVRKSLGLDRPILEQYFQFVGRALTGDFGVSFKTGRTVVEEIGHRYLNTLQLAGAAMLFAVVVGVICGVLCAAFKYRTLDNVILILSLIGISAPAFFVGLVLMIVFSVQLGWLPLTGNDSWRHLILPCVTLGLANAAIIARVMRARLIETLDSDYVRTAYAKGLSGYSVITRHGMRNALMPVITVVGLQMGYLLGGAVITETVFSWPGLGRLIIQSISSRDLPLVQASVLLIAVTFVIINLLTDLLYGLVDPRVEVA